jgi:tetratricopeptide (TPR) repeat protein
VLSAAKLRWKSNDFYRNGRLGQKQNGVDIWGHDAKARHIGIQCKNTVDGISLDVIESEVNNAEAFEPKLDHLYVATTAKLDAPLQKAVRKISTRRRNENKFRVDILFWDDVCLDLAQDNNVFFKHYPQFGSGIHPIKSIVGIMPEALPEILKAATGPLERLNAAQQATIAELGRQLDASKEQVLGFFRIIGETEIEVEAIPGRLVQIAERYKTLVAQAEAEAADDPETAGFKAELRKALDALDLDRADALLAQALAAQDRDLENRALQAAATCARRGHVARTRLRYNEAATHFGAAAARVPAGHDTTRGEYLFEKALALCQQGEEFGDNAALQLSIQAWRTALIFYPRERVPSQWAATQNNLGNALRVLGERERGTACLEEAVEVYRAALEVYTRDQVPLDWAMTQNNLGLTLLRLGELESGTARLEKAAKACRAALEVYTRDQVPLDWAMTQNNLGGILLRLGERESGTARLEKAVEAYRAVLEVYTREQVALDWAMAQDNLGNALLAVGERESETTSLAGAVSAYCAALKVWTRERVPLRWAGTQNNLGNALRALGERESGTAHLEKAVEAYRAALEVYTREHTPRDWAMTQYNLGAALRMLGEQESGTTRLEEAAAAFDACLAVIDTAYPTEWVRRARVHRDEIRAEIARREA